MIYGLVGACAFLSGLVVGFLAALYSVVKLVNAGQSTAARKAIWKNPEPKPGVPQ